MKEERASRVQEDTTLVEELQMAQQLRIESRDEHLLVVEREKSSSLKKSANHSEAEKCRFGNAKPI
eukprot:12924330-Prorocentrum_lima.AAC.1